jgi:hypothetical protein
MQPYIHRYRAASEQIKAPFIEVVLLEQGPMQRIPGMIARGLRKAMPSSVWVGYLGILGSLGQEGVALTRLAQ